MANEAHLRRLKQGVEAWNRWRVEHPAIKPDLIGADLGETDLGWAHLDDTDLTEAILTRAQLTRAQLTGANLTRANLSEAFLTSADLGWANLTEAILTRSFLTGVNLLLANLTRADVTQANLLVANLTKANLTQADLSNADISGTTFGAVDLRPVRGLETVRHHGPSNISIDTLYRSEGHIPEVFLRGAGVPDDFIKYIKSLVGRPFEFYSCFISYSSQDQEIAGRLHADLQRHGVRCWFAPHDIQGGRKLHEQIDQAIRGHERLLLLLSSHSMNSEWVKTEIAKARQREVLEKRQVLFPVRLVSFEAVRNWECFDADSGKDSAREIREYFIPDFSNWKNYDAYKQAFQRLLHDLKPSTTSP